MPSTYLEWATVGVWWNEEANDDWGLQTKLEQAYPQVVADD